MLHYSFSTVFMALIASSILVILISAAFLNRNVMANAGGRLLAFLVGTVILRLLIPYEFPFTTNILLPQFLSRILFAFQLPRAQILGINVSYWRIFELIWAVGILVRLVLGIRDYLHSRNYILKYGTDMTDAVKYREPLDSICVPYGKGNPFHVIELEGLDVPALFCSKKPYILIPRDAAIPSDKLQYILSHEALHYFRHNPGIKLAVRLLSYVYWWNPACIILQKQTNLLLEMSIDRSVVQNNPTAREEYADCLLYMRKQALTSAGQIPASLKKKSAFLLHPQDSDLKKRCTMLFYKPALWKKLIVTSLVTTLVIGTYLASHRYILETSYHPPELAETAIVLTPENTYMIQLGPETYEVYVNDIFMETVTTLDFYPKGIKIYDVKGELIDET